MNKNKKNKNEIDIEYNKKLTELRKKQLIEEVDIILAKLTDEDIEFFEENSDFSDAEIKYMKKRRRLRSNKRAIFYSRIRCNEETLNRIIQTTKEINRKNKQIHKGKEEIIQDKTREERIRVKGEHNRNNR